ncbi:MAG: DUF1211 domain-containing protein, partial [Patescibacteria group bacterium]|nr:DUF1211 domain-containing protein [Patescibacteria group bacterium]
MGTGRLETFSDGVIAIIITIMVLQLKIPNGSSVLALRGTIPAFFAYIVSFSILGIYWSNHHNLIRATKHVTTGIMWANLHLLFWLSLIPFATSWIGLNYQESIPTAFYSVLLFFCAVAYTILEYAIVKHHGKDTKLAKSLGNDLKGKISLGLYTLAIIAA